MKLVSEILGLDKTEGDIGVEIEAEGKDLLMIDNVFWRCEDDGSLRGRFPDQRCEYIFKKPVKIDKAEALIRHLSVHLQESKLDFSHRTSVHVHVNVQRLEFQQLLAMMYTYYLLEEPFMTFCGKSRKGNNFCLRLEDAEGILEEIGNLFSEGEYGFQTIYPDKSRYAAMNIEAVKKYGSLEFRGMEGNLDVGRITTWCKALVSMREYAAKANTPQAVYERFKELGPKAFLQEVLGELHVNFSYPRLVKDMLKSFSISIDLPFKFVRFTQKPVVKGDDFKIGDIINYDQAVDCVERGGNVAYHDMDNSIYRVINVPIRPAKKAEKMPKKVDWANVVLDVPMPIFHDEDF